MPGVRPKDGARTRKFLSFLPYPAASVDYDSYARNPSGRQSCRQPMIQADTEIVIPAFPGDLALAGTSSSGAQRLAEVGMSNTRSPWCPRSSQQRPFIPHLESSRQWNDCTRMTLFKKYLRGKRRRHIAEPTFYFDQTRETSLQIPKTMLEAGPVGVGQQDRQTVLMSL